MALLCVKRLVVPPTFKALERRLLEGGRLRAAKHSSHSPSVGRRTLPGLQLERFREDSAQFMSGFRDIRRPAAECEASHMEFPGPALFMMAPGTRAIEDGHVDAADGLLVVQVCRLGTLSRDLPQSAPVTGLGGVGGGCRAQPRSHVSGARARAARPFARAAVISFLQNAARW